MSNWRWQHLQLIVHIALSLITTLIFWPACGSSNLIPITLTSKQIFCYAMLRNVAPIYALAVDASTCWWCVDLLMMRRLADDASSYPSTHTPTNGFQQLVQYAPSVFRAKWATEEIFVKILVYASLLYMRCCHTHLLCDAAIRTCGWCVDLRMMRHPILSSPDEWWRDYSEGGSAARLILS